MDISLDNLLKNKELLFELLDKVDVKADKPKRTKRREAYITEMFFEKKVLPKIPGLNSYTTGWCHFKIDKQRSWAKVILRTNAKKDDRLVDKAFVQAVKRKNPKENFFILTLDDDFRYKVMELVIKDNELVLRTTKLCERILVGNMYKELTALISRDKLEPAFCSKWLSNELNSELFKLLTQRLLMNTAVSYPVDIDAIELKDNQIIIHEFKRKDVCPSGSYVKKGLKLCPPWDVFTLRDTIEKHLVSKGFLIKENNSFLFNNCTPQDVYHEINTQMIEKGCELDSNAKCYGLDTSHVFTVDFCEKNQFVYNHLIWDTFETTGKKPTIPELFNKDLSLKEKATIFYSRLDKDSFYGVTRTSGDDSGTFFSGLRMQATFLFDHISSNAIYIE